jgi:MarR family transcriptional regulator, transcriptional regulator for hemolysin
MVLELTNCYPRGMDVDLAMLLNQASYALATKMTQELAEVGISPREWCVLSKARAGDMTQNRVAELAALDRTTMVVTVDALERAGLAVRRPSSTDRRARIIAVTEAGERVVAQADAIVAGVYGEILGELPPEERDAFVAGLARLVDGCLATPLHTERRPRRRGQPQLVRT